MSIVSFVLFGLVAGLVARMVTPGRHAIGCLATVAVGMVGALLGGLIGDVALGHKVRFSWHLGPFLLAVAGAGGTLTGQRLSVGVVGGRDPTDRVAARVVRVGSGGRRRARRR